MMRLWALMLLFAVPAHGQESWTPLDTDQIRAALSDRVVFYPDARQTFLASGETIYEVPEPAWGAWEARDDQYCVRWGSAKDWTCFDIDLSDDGNSLRFIGAMGDITVGRYQ